MIKEINYDMHNQNDFNDVFCRPPNFCFDCGEILDFELIKNNCIICQKCGGEVSIENIISHEEETRDYYTNSKEWVNKLTNVEDKMRTKRELERKTVNFYFIYLNTFR